MRAYSVTLVIFLIALLFTVVGIVQIWRTIGIRAGNAIQIQSVSFEASRTIIYVQNVGEAAVILDSVYINEEKFNIDRSNCFVAAEYTTTIKINQTAEIAINTSYTEKIHIKIVCNDGTFIEADWNS